MRKERGEGRERGERRGEEWWRRRENENHLLSSIESQLKQIEEKKTKKQGKREKKREKKEQGWESESVKEGPVLTSREIEEKMNSNLKAFNESKVKNEEAVKKILKELEHSEEEEGSEEEEEEEGLKVTFMQGLILFPITLGFSFKLFFDQDDVEEKKYSKENVKKGNVKKMECIICLENISGSESVWNCCSCFLMLHLQCARQWATDGSKNTGMFSKENFPSLFSKWNCPKCLVFVFFFISFFFTLFLYRQVFFFRE